MKKVGIITIVDYDNYGNRLQNYAVQEVLKSLGWESETIVNKPFNMNNIPLRISRFLKKSKKELIASLMIKLHIAIKKLRQGILKTKYEKKQLENNQRIEKLKKDREARFKEFTKENIKETPYTVTPDSIPNDLYKNYNYFIVGSDQVWNPHYRMGSSIDFLTFAKPEQRIAFSASFGVSNIPHQYTNNYRKWLSEMQCISVREETGAEIVKNLTGKNVDVLVDPTLLLNKEQWLSIAKSSKYKPNKRYILTYFLGELSQKTIKTIDYISKQHNLEIVNLANAEDEKKFLSDPAEFLDYINSAEIFLTDSFHGAVFSIIFEKPFIVYERISKIDSMNSRISTLLKKFNLEDRYCENISINSDIFNVNFFHVPQIMEEERKKAFNYLDKALKEKGSLD